MPNAFVFLNALPSPEDFYGNYWNRVPFVVKNAIPEETRDNLISADELAGLAMEEAPMSRMVKTAGPEQQWSCKFGPFSEDEFAATGDQDWSFLVQNVEQFDPGTATLLRHFSFAPRWLMDDIMVSYSEPGGSVGPHIDSYHVFLVQGQGKRQWKIGRAPVTEEIYIDGLDLKVLQTGFGTGLEGDTIEMSAGDVLYLPPKFAHEGITTEASLTFSVGFLGPKLSELFGSYAQYVAELEQDNHRYVGAGLEKDSAGFVISATASENIQNRLIESLKSTDFNRWLVSFFTESSHEEFGEYSERDEMLSLENFQHQIQSGMGLHKPEYVKFALTGPVSGIFYLGFDSHLFTLDQTQLALVQKLILEQIINSNSDPEAFSNSDNLDLLLELYNHQALEFTDC